MYLQMETQLKRSRDSFFNYSLCDTMYAVFNASFIVHLASLFEFFGVFATIFKTRNPDMRTNLKIKR